VKKVAQKLCLQIFQQNYPNETINDPNGENSPNLATLRVDVPTKNEANV
jgi:hypothetical protein